MNASAVTFWVRRLRLASGVILFTFVVSHFINHALGLISLAAANEGREWFLAVWRGVVASPLLVAAFYVHFALALWALFQRRRLLRIPFSEAAQLILGLSIIPLLVEHVMATHAASELTGLIDDYTYVLLSIWHFKPSDGVMQTIALLVAWGHGCIGLHFWLRLKPWYGRALPFLFGAAILIPVLGLLGFAEAGREVDRLAADPAWLRAAMAQSFGRIAREDVAEITQRIMGVRGGFFAIVLATLLARLVRTLIERRRGRVRITYADGRRVDAPRGMTLLEISWLNGVPHASVCGGRGRCSTCRVRITRGADTLPPPAAGEKSVLARVAADDPSVRLACQIRPTKDLAVTPLLPASAGPRDAHARPAQMQGREREVAILFADLRGFTQLSEHKLPYDVVFMLNRYFAAMGGAVEKSGGHVDKFIGDGVMALFGTGGEAPELACRQALAAARRMGLELETLNQTLTHDLNMPLRIGVGIHFGPAIVGEMGHGRAVSLTAIGDTVNTASRIETLTKDYAVELVISEDVARRGGLNADSFARHETEIRGRKEKLAIRAVARCRDLPEAIEAATA